tara:strand:+ start:2754 stop:3644 length:891 start_codon:yes stop_codon:yes gene_type:complete
MRTKVFLKKTIESLIKLSNHLDSTNQTRESDFVDKIIEKIARNTIAFDLDTGEVFDKAIKSWRHPTDEELAGMFFGEDLGDVGDLNPDSISYKKDEDGNDGVLELRDEEGEEIAEIIVNEPPKNTILWNNLSRKHVDSRPKNMTLPDGNSVTIKEIKLESTKMIKELIKLATHLDSKGLVKEANYLDGIIEKKSQVFDNFGESFGPNKVGKSNSNEPHYNKGMQVEDKYKWMKAHVDWANEQSEIEIKDRQTALMNVSYIMNQIDSNSSKGNHQKAHVLEEKLEKSIDSYHGRIKK